MKISFASILFALLALLNSAVATEDKTSLRGSTEEERDLQGGAFLPGVCPGRISFVCWYGASFGTLPLSLTTVFCENDCQHALDPPAWDSRGYQPCICDKICNYLGVQISYCDTRRQLEEDGDKQLALPEGEAEAAP